VPFSLTLQDQMTVKELCVAHVVVEESLAPEELQAAFAHWLMLMAAVTDARIIAARVDGKAVAVPAEQPDKPGHRGIATTGLVNFSLVTPVPRTWSLAVPAFAQALVERGPRVKADQPAIQGNCIFQRVAEGQGRG
jgi:hypothetical protein